MIQLQGDQRKDVQEFLTDKKEGLELDAKTIKVSFLPLASSIFASSTDMASGSRFLNAQDCTMPTRPERESSR